MHGLRTAIALLPRLALPLMLLGGCLPDAGTDDVPASEPTTSLATTNATCVDYQGISNCGLGAAVLTPSRDGSLDVTGLRTAGRDGVAFQLPEVTSFDVTGTRERSSTGSVLTRAISDGKVTSTMTVRDTIDGFTVSGTFTGNTGATYNAELYNRGQRVGTVAGIKSGEGLSASWVDPEVARARIRIRIRIGFVVITITIGLAATEAPTEGACVWDYGLPEDTQATTKLADGTPVTFDRVRLVENVDPAGSYPYLSFDRIDYTSSDGGFRIDGEHAQ
jgi:hypothetical protein